jgi:hypothetical protein
VRRRGNGRRIEADKLGCLRVESVQNSAAKSRKKLGSVRLVIYFHNESTRLEGKAGSRQNMTELEERNGVEGHSTMHRCLQM